MGRRKTIEQLERELADAKRRRDSKVPKFIKKGARVDYHSIIGDEVTTPDCVVQCDPYPLGGPDGEMVVFLDKVSGCVSCRALSEVK